MRNDIHPFTSKYVRQAIAYTLDRPRDRRGAVQGLRRDRQRQPVRPGVPVHGPPSVPQRAQNLKLAKQLLAKAGVPQGFSTPLLTETTQEMPHFAEIVKQSAAKIGVNINLTIETPTKYYGYGGVREVGLAGRRR